MTISGISESKNFTLHVAIGRWFTNLPTAKKIATFVTGMGILAFASFNVTILGIDVLVTLSITGALLTIASATALVFFRYCPNQQAPVQQQRQNPVPAESSSTLPPAVAHKVEVTSGSQSTSSSEKTMPTPTPPLSGDFRVDAISIIAPYLRLQDLASLAQCDRLCHETISNFITSFLRERASAPNPTYYPEYHAWRKAHKIFEKDSKDAKDFPSVTDVRFGGSQFDDEELMELLDTCCNTLISLNLAGCCRQNPFFSDRHLSRSFLSKIIDHRKVFTNLKHLDISGGRFEAHSIINFIRLQPQLESIILSGLYLDPKEADNFLPQLLPSLPRDLKILDLADRSCYSNVLEQLSEICPRLKSLSFTERMLGRVSFPPTLEDLSCPPYPWVLQKIKESCHSLKSFSTPFANRAYKTYSYTLSDFFDSPFPTIEKLSIDLNTDLLRKIIVNCPNLKLLRCRNKGLTEQGILDICEQQTMVSLGHLCIEGRYSFHCALLILRACPNIHSLTLTLSSSLTLSSLPSLSSLHSPSFSHRNKKYFSRIIDERPRNLKFLHLKLDRSFTKDDVSELLSSESFQIMLQQLERVDLIFSLDMYSISDDAKWHEVQSLLLPPKVYLSCSWCPDEFIPFDL